MWGDGTTLYVLDRADQKSYAYWLVDNPDTTDVNEYGTRRPGRDISFSRPGHQPCRASRSIENTLYVY